MTAGGKTGRELAAERSAETKAEMERWRFAGLDEPSRRPGARRKAQTG